MDRMRPLRIVRVIARLNVGGPARHVILLAERLDSLGCETALVAGNVERNEASMESFAAERGIQPLMIPELGREIHPLRDLRVLWKLLGILRRHRPDVLHTHTAKAGAVGRVAGFLYRRAHWRGLWAPRPLLVYHTFHGHVLRGYFSARKERFFRCLERWLAGFSTRLITLSPSLRQELFDMKVVPPGKVTVVPLGTELDAFLALQEGVPSNLSFRDELKIPSDVPLVGIVGRLVPIKDHFLFLESASLLRNGVGGESAAGAHFVVVGDGEMRAALVSRACSLGLEGRCHFVGWRMDLPGIYQSLDVVCLTSKNEGTPLSLIEAMASARPVVATCVGGVPDVVGESGESESFSLPLPGTFCLTDTGALVQAGDAQGFARALCRLIDDEGLRLRLGRGGRTKAGDRYTVDRLAKDLWDIYQQDMRTLTDPARPKPN